ncbi:Abi family protein [Solibacillus sp. FSL H8-0538]|uniref:Abi family protein n=1 Tax=Solibacillus sp. FSL H8-0538 TaxID=2921400 RepID=UPI0030F5884A
MKPFKTHRQQLAILRARGLKINNGSKALRILENESYYAVINGYKDFFLVKDAIAKNKIPETYIPNATFEEIYELYSFDRDLRNTLLEYLLKFESNIKSKIAYRFSEKYKEPHAYLILKNYTRHQTKLKDVLSLISTISNTISKNGKKKGSIAHYLDKHDGVPLWVLVNYLTIGNMQYFYSCLDNSLQNTIAKDFAISYKRDYGNVIHYTPDMLESTLKTVTYFRNVCAHEERLYNFKLHKPAPSADIAKALSLGIHLLDKGNIFTVLSFLKLVLPKKEHQKMIKNITKIICTYSPKFNSISFDAILLEMGLVDKWNELI